MSLALENADTLHLVYGSDDSTEGVYYQRSFDSGETWEPRRILLRKRVIIENEDTLIQWPSNSADGFIFVYEDHVHIMWVLGIRYPTGEESGSLIYLEVGGFRT